MNAQITAKCTSYIYDQPPKEIVDPGGGNIMATGLKGTTASILNNWIINSVIDTLATCAPKRHSHTRCYKQRHRGLAGEKLRLYARRRAMA